MSGSNVSQPDRNLAMELVRATEAGALAAARWMGRGDKIAADQAAVDGLRTALATIEMDGIVVIGEGEKDEAPMLYIGEEVGKGQEPRVDIAVDPVEGTRLLANGMPNAISVVAISERGTMHFPAKIAYMEKLATGPAAADAIDIERPLRENLERVAKAKGMGIRDLTVVVLDRPRHSEIVEEIRSAGARIKFITDGDVAGALMAAMPETGLDLLVGIGGATEGTISACALKCMGGNLQSRIWPRNDEERQLVQDMNLDVTKVYTMDDLVSSNNVFFAATGITDGELLSGVHYSADGATTDSLVMRSKSGTIRRVRASHHLDKLTAFAATRFD
jgi:fructose-1,6-bisphosphatase II